MGVLIGLTNRERLSTQTPPNHLQLLDLFLLLIITNLQILKLQLQILLHVPYIIRTFLIISMSLPLINKRSYAE